VHLPPLQRNVIVLPMNNSSLAIAPQWIVCVDNDNRVLENHAVIITNGAIDAIVAWPEAADRYRGIDVLGLPGQALMPGLINAHTHHAMSLLRGYADDLPLMTWLTEHIWPAEGQHVNRDFVADGTRLAIAESIRGGVTCFNDMYFFPDVVADVATELGSRASIGMIVIDFPTVWAQNPDEYLSKGVALHEGVAGNPLVTTMLAPHAPYTVSAEPLQKIAALRDQLGVGVHIHVHETAFEVAQFIEQHGCRPLAHLDNLGLVDSSLAAVHMTQMTDDEIARVASSNSNVLHCPESNLKLASGAAFSGKCAIGDAAQLTATDVLRMATINGAKALGIADTTGSIEVGKQADLVSIDFNAIELQPVYQPVSHIVYAAGRQNVSNVWVAGQQLLDQRALTRCNEADLIANARQWANRIQNAKQPN